MSFKKIEQANFRANLNNLKDIVHIFQYDGRRSTDKHRYCFWSNSQINLTAARILFPAKIELSDCIQNK